MEKFDLNKFLKLSLQAPKLLFKIYIKKNNFKNLKIFNFFINLNYIKFGKTVDVSDLFNSNELNIFNFYKKNKKKYKKALDIGANIGIHTIILSKLGYKVHSYEPEPEHFQKLVKVLKKNKIKNRNFKIAISDKNGFSNFIKIIGNTTGSHLEGDKKKPYGKMKKFKVKTIAINDIVKDYDLIKVDCEGGEKKIFTSLDLKLALNTDFVVEVSDNVSRSIIWKKFLKSKYKIYSQKNNWKICKTKNNLPKNWSEGTIVISTKKLTF